MPEAWPPPWLTDVDSATLARIRTTLDGLEGAQLEMRGFDVCIVDSSHCESSAGRSLLATVEALLERETRYQKRERKMRGIAQQAKSRLAGWTPRKQPPDQR